MKLEDARGRYVAFVKNTFPRDLTLDGTRVVGGRRRGDGDVRDAHEAGHAARRHVVGTVMSNLGLERALDAAGDRSLVRTAVGDRYVVEAMRRGGFNLGGEQSGHLVFLDYSSTGTASSPRCRSSP